MPSFWAFVHSSAFGRELKRAEFGRELLVVIAMGLVWVLGVLFYFYEPLAGMTCPPMQWGYPRTVKGFSTH